jgi:hypothetical protein
MQFFKSASNTWKLHLLVSLILCAPAVLNAQPAAEPAAPQSGAVPIIIIEHSSHDFGIVQPGATLHHDFTLHNKGAAPLNISQVTSDCGCTAALASADEIPPGGQGTINIAFTPGEHEGLQRETITIKTNDPAAESLQLEVSAEVKLLLALSPATIEFPACIISTGSIEPQYARLTGSLSDSVSITAIDNPNAFINVEIEHDSLDDDASRKIRFSVLPGMATGRFRERIVFTTDSPDVKTLSLFVMGEVLGNINLTPKHLPLGTVSAAGVIGKHITLQSTRDDFKFTVTGISSSVEGLSTKLITVNPGTEYRIEVSLSGDYPHPVINGEITIATDAADQPEMTVRVFGRIAQKTGPDAPRTDPS